MSDLYQRIVISTFILINIVLLLLLFFLFFFYRLYLSSIKRVDLSEWSEEVDDRIYFGVEQTPRNVKRTLGPRKDKLNQYQARLEKKHNINLQQILVERHQTSLYPIYPIKEEAAKCKVMS
jgi:hypothetical protein